MAVRRKRSAVANNRLSKRIRSLAPQSTYPSASLPYLPPELKNVILRNLSKFELKQVRLVSKDWSLATVPLLFDRIYIPPRESNLNIFSQIINHPVLCHGPTSLVWDVSHFQHGVGEEQYIELLVSNTKDT